MYTFPDQVNWTAHFLFDGRLIEDKKWASLPQGAKTVFPVIACLRNNRGYAYPSEQTIAALSGKTEKTVREAIKGLSKVELISLSHHITEKGRRAKKFHVETPDSGDKLTFPFHLCILEKGLWQHLSPSAHALYPVMRHFSFFDEKTSSTYEDQGKASANSDKTERDYNFCSLEQNKLAEYAGISRQTLFPAFDSLASCGLIESLDKDPGGQTFLWKVFFKTESWFARDVLNENILKRYKRR